MRYTLIWCVGSTPKWDISVRAHLPLFFLTRFLASVMFSSFVYILGKKISLLNIVEISRRQTGSQ